MATIKDEKVRPAPTPPVGATKAAPSDARPEEVAAAGDAPHGADETQPLHDGGAAFDGDEDEDRPLAHRKSAKRGATATVPSTAAGVALHLAPGTASGYKGVRPMGSRFYARRVVDGTTKNLGTFDTAEEAAACYAQSLGQVPGVAETEMEAAA
eukprot:1645948-Prymnesium_polylepis.1